MPRRVEVKASRETGVKAVTLPAPWAEGAFPGLQEVRLHSADAETEVTDPNQGVLR